MSKFWRGTVFILALVIGFSAVTTSSTTYAQPATSHHLSSAHALFHSKDPHKNRSLVKSVHKKALARTRSPNKDHKTAYRQNAP